MLQKISISNKCCSFELSINQKNHERKCITAANQNIRMISEGSCDTEDWSNDAENSALHHRNILHFKIYYNRKWFLYILIIFHNITVFTIFLVK